jgi:small ligand-binding sensory domain FIST
MRWGSALSHLPAPEAAFEEAAAALEGQLQGAVPDLLLAFASAEHAGAFPRLAALAARRFPKALLCGCTAGGVIGGAREAESGPALSLTAARLPGVELAGFHSELSGLPGPGADAAWRDLVGRAPQDRLSLLLLADPFSMEVGELLAGLDRAYPGAPKFGGLASGGQAPGENRLLLGRAQYQSGAVGVAFSGDLQVDTVVAQGCRPIGKPMLVTQCRGGLLQQLDGRPPLEVLTRLHASLGERDRELMTHSLFLGLEMREERIEYLPGELLVRNLVGADAQSGALAIGAELRPMQVVQFMLRDARTAEEDLQRLLDRQRRSARTRQPAGALLFSCVGRGAGLFGCADHDTGLFEERLGPTPLGGSFCNGEIGPVGGTTFLHGYTSAFALFRPA